MGSNRNREIRSSRIVSAPIPSRNRKTDASASKLQHLHSQTRVVLLPVDPYHVHAYWEVGDDDIARIRTRLGTSRHDIVPVLRFHDVTDCSSSPAASSASFDIPIDLAAQNRYVHLLSPEKMYYTELGLKRSRDRFIALARSNIVEIPPDTIAEVESHKPRIDVQAAPPPAPESGFTQLESRHRGWALVAASEPPESGAADPHEYNAHGMASAHERAEVPFTAHCALPFHEAGLWRYSPQPKSEVSESGSKRFQSSRLGPVRHLDLSEVNDQQFTAGVSSLVAGSRISQELQVKRKE